VWRSLQAATIETVTELRQVGEETGLEETSTLTSESLRVVTVKRRKTTDMRRREGKYICI
jgi:hypothetical protein